MKKMAYIKVNGTTFGYIWQSTKNKEYFVNWCGCNGGEFAKWCKQIAEIPNAINSIFGVRVSLKPLKWCANSFNQIVADHPTIIESII